MRDDLRFAWRRLTSTPVFTITAVLTLALGIGANTAIFSVADAVLFRPLPYADPDALHLLQMRNAESGARAALMTYAHLQTIDRDHRGLSRVALLDSKPALIYTDASGASRVSLAAVTANYFDLLGARATRGRLLTSTDAAAVGRAAVVTDAFWRTHLGASEEIAGRAITIGSVTFDVVGVLPRGFLLPSNHAGNPSIITVLPPLAAMKDGGTFHPIVRRDPGVTRQQAQAEIDALVRPLTSAEPARAYLPHLEDIRSVLYPTGRPIMWLLLSASALLLLLGCANLANMLLARARRGEREIGIRIALGARRGRLVRELIYEALLVALAGAAAALLVTSWSFDILLQQVPPVAYGRAPVGVDGRVLGFGVAMGILAALLIAAIPAWRATRLDASRLLNRRDHDGRGTFGRPLVAAQVAIAVLLVFGASAAVRALIDVLHVPLGFSSENVIRLSGTPPALRGRAAQDFYVRAIERLTQRGDVVAAGGVGSVPLTGSMADEAIVIGGERLRTASFYYVLPGYFEALDIPLRRGRPIDMNDARTGADVAVLSESAARILFPDRDPLDATLSNGRGRTVVVVGVAGDVRRNLDQESSHPVYVLGGEGTRPTLSILVRTRGRSEATLGEIKRELAALAPGVPIVGGWWADAIAAITPYRNPRFQTIVLGSFAGLALILIATGILGVVSFLIAVRTREMGIRSALGAEPTALVRLMLRQTMSPVVIGLVIGVLATRWAGRLVEAQLFKVDIRDPATLSAAALTVLATAALAAYLPARRAGRVDPIAVLRAD